ncbi:MAG: glycosyltransferase family 4 protein [Rhodospirillales bacterium]|nr:glycosyltransferase family 4 protein [Rhodospirillales bacterium]
MKILVLTDRFVPEVSAVSVRTMAHARVWLEDGHEVTVVTCAPNFPRGVLFDGYENKLIQEETIDGVRVIRIWSYLSANAGIVKRTFDIVSFMLSSILLCKRFGDFDIIVATSPPITVPIAGYVISRRCKRPWVFELRDLWPASISAVGVTQSRLLGLVEKLELFLYRKAERVICLTRSFRTNLESRGIPTEKLDVITNGIDLEQFQPLQPDPAVRSQLGVDADSFLVGYIGTTGMAHGLETVVEAAHLCRDHPKIRFLIMGEGAKRDELQNQAQQLQLTNLIFKNFVPHQDVPKYLTALDLAIVHLKPDPLFKTVIPSKIFEIMALGVPLLHAVEGESAEIVAEANSGRCLPSGDAKAMGEAIIELSKDRPRLEAFAQNGRQAVVNGYDRRVLARNVTQSLERALASSRS